MRAAISFSERSKSSLRGETKQSHLIGNTVCNIMKWVCQQQHNDTVDLFSWSRHNKVSCTAVICSIITLTVCILLLSTSYNLTAQLNKAGEGLKQMKWSGNGCSFFCNNLTQLTQLKNAVLNYSCSPQHTAEQAGLYRFLQ